jgi:hypothetical protein
VSREDEPQGGSSRLGCEDSLIHQRRYDSPRLPFAGADDGIGIAAWQLSAVKHSFEDAAGFWGQLSKPDLFFSPKQDASAQAIGLRQALHEIHLIDTHPEKELRKLGERFFA